MFWSEVMDYEVIIDAGHFFESPRWRDGRLWVSDFYAPEVYSTDLAGNVRVEAVVPNHPSGLGWLPDGRLLVVSMRDQKILRREENGELVVHADLTGLAGGQMINDMLVDERGHAFVGSVGFNPSAGDPVRSAPLFRVAPDGSAEVAASDLLLPNGMAMLPGPVLIVGESLGNCSTAFDVQDDGTLTNRRVWASYGPRIQSDDVTVLVGNAGVGADGCAADAEGALWVADAFHGRVIRLKDGHVVREIGVSDLGEKGAMAVALGGHDGRTMFICTAPDFDETARTAAKESKVIAVRVDVPAIDFA
jgi:sugar lactone lactonase YvrE